MTSFTKGPWVVLLRGQDLDIDGPGGYYVASVSNFNERPENEANAHLIAASPDLYEALRKIEMRAAAPITDDTFDDLKRDLYHIASIARAALTRAAGEGVRS